MFVRTDVAPRHSLPSSSSNAMPNARNTEETTVLATYSARRTAEMARDYLADADIRAFVSADDAGGMHPQMQRPHGVKLVVLRGAAEQARSRLDDADLLPANNEGRPPTDARWRLDGGRLGFRGVHPRPLSRRTRNPACPADDHSGVIDKNENAADPDRASGPTAPPLIATPREGGRSKRCCQAVSCGPAPPSHITANERPPGIIIAAESLSMSPPRASIAAAVLRCLPA